MDFTSRAGKMLLAARRNNQNQTNQNVNRENRKHLVLTNKEAENKEILPEIRRIADNNVELDNNTIRQETVLQATLNDSDIQQPSTSVQTERPKRKKLETQYCHVTGDLDEDQDFSDLDVDYEPSSSNESELSEDNIALTNNNQTRDEAAEHTRNGTNRGSRWKKANPSTWKRNVTKKLRLSGQAYKVKKKSYPAKFPKLVNCKCPFKCSLKFNEADRLYIFQTYWKLEDYNRKKDFILKHVKTSPTDRQRPRKDNPKYRSHTNQFFFMKDDSEIRVCRNFFLKTLSISNGPLNKALQGKNACGVFDRNDLRGKHVPSNKLSDLEIQTIKEHIESFPVTESHYIRKSSRRLYLDCKLSISKMYSLYVELCKEKSITPRSQISYKRIFCQNYNYSFFKPKKDQCTICVNYNAASAEAKLTLEKDYKEHKARELDANNAKMMDKIRATNDKSFVTATFDLQSVLQIPSSDVSPMYYSRKLCSYNLTIYEGAPPNNAHCYTWTEVNGKRGSLEIGTCLYKYLQQLPDHVHEVSLFSDTCGGQNRNQNVAAIRLYAVLTSPHIQVIEQKFLESGHSMMECDSMHSAIETQKKYVPVYTMHDGSQFLN